MCLLPPFGSGSTDSRYSNHISIHIPMRARMDLRCLDSHIAVSSPCGHLCRRVEPDPCGRKHHVSDLTSLWQIIIILRPVTCCCFLVPLFLFFFSFFFFHHCYCCCLPACLPCPFGRSGLAKSRRKNGGKKEETHRRTCSWPAKRSHFLCIYFCCYCCCCGSSSLPATGTICT